jgi:hypothetical protein
LDPGNIVRSTISAGWTRKTGAEISALTAGFGRNDTDHGSRSAFFVEGSRHHGKNTLYGRFEALQVETTLLQTDTVTAGAASELNDPVFAFTIGGVRDVWSWRGFEGGIGADLGLYGVPATLQPMYSAHPVSFHMFFRLRPPAGAMGRMWNMRMTQPMTAHAMPGM